MLTKKFLNKHAVKTICAVAWGVPTEMQISNIGPNIFMFTLSPEQITQDIMLRGPWAVMNHIIILTLDTRGGCS